MARMLIKLGVLLAGNAIGLIIANALFDTFELNGAAFVIAIVIFTIAEFILLPLITKLTSENVPILEHGSTIITTFLALLITDIISDGLNIEGFGTWILSTLVVWLATLLAGLLLAKLFIKDRTS